MGAWLYRKRAINDKRSMAENNMTNKAFAIVKELEDRGENEMTNEMTTKKEKNMTTETIEAIEMLDKDFPDTELSESQEIEIEKMGEKIKELRVEEVLFENDARFFGICSTFEETMKRRYLAGLEFKLENATLVLFGNNGIEVYYMVVADLGKLSEDIKRFKNKVLSYEGALNPDFDKVGLTFSSADEDFRAVDFVESIEIKKENDMTNKQIEIETILTQAVEAAYAAQNEETLAQLGAVEDAVQSAIDGADYNEVKGMATEEAYIFYFEWALGCIASVL